MATKKAFTFPMGALVGLNCTTRSGVIIGRAQYARRNPAYFVELPGDHGSMVQDWFDEESLVATDGSLTKGSEFRVRPPSSDD